MTDRDITPARAEAHADTGERNDPAVTTTKTKPTGPAIQCTGTTVDVDQCTKKAITGADRCAQHDGRVPSGPSTRKSTFGTALRSGRKWRAVYPHLGRRHTKGGFATKAEAQAFLASVQTGIRRAEWADPALGRQTLSYWADQWLATTTHLRDSTRRGYEASLRTHVQPVFGQVALARIETPEIKKFLAGMASKGSAPGRVAQARKVLRLIFNCAVEAQAIPKNPCVGVRVPRGRRQEMHFLTEDQVEELADTISNPPERKAGNGAHTTGRQTYPEYGVLVRVAAYTGLRAAEIDGLRVGRVDLTQRRIQVAETVTDVGGRLMTGPTKTGRIRTVPFPATVADDLAPLLVGKSPDDYVFTAPGGGPVRHSNFYARHFRPAVSRAGLNNAFRFHDLRHTYAGLLIADKVHAKAIMEWMGHSSITVTMDRYGHLLPGIEEQALDALDARARDARSRHKPTR